LLGEELDPGPAGAAHEITLRGEEPTDLHGTLNRRFLGRAIGHLNAQEFEDAWHRGVVEKLVPDRLVATLASRAASEPHQRTEGANLHTAMMRALAEAGNQRSSRLQLLPGSSSASISGRILSRPAR
jgi:hypothetical protein